MSEHVGITVYPSKTSNTVVAQFEREVGFLRMSPQEAVTFAEALVTKAMDLHESKIILPSVFNK